MEWSQNLISIISTLIVIMTALGTVFGMFFVQNRKINNEIKFEQKRTQWSERKEKEQQEFKIYNKFLENNSVSGVIKYVGPSREHYKFDVRKYREQMRPILFEEFHVIDKEIVGIVMKIEDCLAECGWYEEIDEHNSECLVNWYSDVIKLIKKKYMDKHNDY